MTRTEIVRSMTDAVCMALKYNVPPKKVVTMLAKAAYDAGKRAGKWGR